MLGNKNKYGTLPFFSTLNSLEKCGCSTGVLTPCAALPPFQLPVNDQNASWRLVNCDGSDQDLDDSLLTYICDADGNTVVVQYDGGYLGSSIPEGKYYIELKQGDQICYSDYLNLCCFCLPEMTQIKIASCQEIDSCCDELEALYQPNFLPRMYSRFNGGNWWFYMLGQFFYNNTLVSNGVTNIVWNHQLFDNATNAPLLFNSGINFAFTTGVPLTTTAVRYEGTVTFDLLCADGIVHTFQLTINEIINQPPATQTFWQFFSSTPACEDLTGGGSFVIESILGIFSQLNNEIIQIGNPAISTIISGDSVAADPDGTISIRHEVRTDCNTIIKNYSLTYDIGDICNTYELIEN